MAVIRYRGLQRKQSKRKVDAYWSICMVLLQHTVRMKSYFWQIKSDRINYWDGLKIQEDTGSRRDLQNRLNIVVMHTAQKEACLVMVNLRRADFNRKKHLNNRNLL